MEADSLANDGVEAGYIIDEFCFNFHVFFMSIVIWVFVVERVYNLVLIFSTYGFGLKWLITLEWRGYSCVLIVV